MFVGSTTLSFLLPSVGKTLLEAQLLFLNVHSRACSISGLLRDSSEYDLKNNCQKRFNANSRVYRRTVIGKIYAEICADSANNGLS